MHKLFSDFRESTTFKCVVVGLSILYFKFAVGGLDFGFGEFPVIDALDFGAAAAALLAVWLNREWRKMKEKQNAQ